MMRSAHSPAERPAFRPLLRILLGITAIAALTLGTPALAEDSARIVYASFAARANADQALARHPETAPEPLEIIEVSKDGEVWYRMTGTRSLPVAAQRIKLAEAHALGFSGAWLLIEAAPTLNEPPVHVPAPRIAPAPPRQIPAPVSTPDAVAGTSPPISPVSITPAPTNTLPGSSADPLASTDVTTDPINITRHADAAVRIDGRLDEPVWSSLPGHGKLTVVEPDVLTAPAYETATRLFYTDDGLYIGITAEQPPEHLIARLSSRDQEVNRDGVQVFLDTSGEGLYGLYFGVNLGGTLSDGTLLPERQLSPLWDGPWEGSSEQTEDGYNAEMFLPWSMMAMPDTGVDRRMGVAVTRRVAYLDEEWGWPALPSSEPRFISGLQPLSLRDVNPRQQLALFPFAASSVDRTRSEDRHRAGLDVFWRPSSALQLTATLNPDFGVVESDDVVVNLTAFETFFPEKRLFFLEGNDIFITSSRSQVRSQGRSAGARSLSNNFFSPPTTLLNTRRIGGAARAPVVPDGITVPGFERSKPTELLGALKATGQNGALRYGVMAAAEDDIHFYATRDADGSEVRLRGDGRNFGAVRLLYEQAGNGRRAYGFMTTQVSHPDGNVNTHGIDLQFRGASGRLSSEVQLMASDKNNRHGYGGYVDVNWVPGQGVMHRFSFDWFDDELDIDDFGFLRRNDLARLHYVLSLRTAQSERYRLVANTLSLSHERNSADRPVRTSIYFGNSLTFHNRSQLNTTFVITPARWEDRLTDGNGSYKTDDGGIFSLAYGTDTSRVLSTAVGFTLMTEDIGDVTRMGQVGITYKPMDRVSFEMDLMYRRPDGWLIHLADRTLATYEAVHWQPGLAMDLFLSARQQLRFSLQWVGIKARAQALWQVPARDGSLDLIAKDITAPTYDFNISRLTSQLRYRWEIAPLSDLFVVYTRGSNVPTALDAGFGDLFTDAVTDPVVDLFVIKLRYRFGLD